VGIFPSVKYVFRLKLSPFLSSQLATFFVPIDLSMALKKKKRKTDEEEKQLPEIIILKTPSAR
jgi:hypothetical protein